MDFSTRRARKHSRLPSAANGTPMLLPCLNQHSPLPPFPSHPSLTIHPHAAIGYQIYHISDQFPLLRPKDEGEEKLVVVVAVGVFVVDVEPEIVVAVWAVDMIEGIAMVVLVREDVVVLAKRT